MEGSKGRGNRQRRRESGHQRQRSELAHAYVELFTGVRKLLHDISLGRSKPIVDLNDYALGDLERE